MQIIHFLNEIGIMSKVKNENCFNLNKNNVKKIESSISENNKVLLCILSNYQSYNSYCYINTTKKKPF